MTGNSENILTIFVPTYNGALTIDNLLKTLLPQCDERVKVVVSDNASTDGTPDIIRKYQLDYPFLDLIESEKNVGPDSNFLKCLLFSSSKYSLLISDDDVVLEGSLTPLLDFLDCNEDMGLVYLNAVGFHGQYIDAEHCEKFNGAIYDDAQLCTSDKVEFMRYAGRMWGFLSCFVCLTEAVKSIQEPERFKGTYWLQSYMHILCADYDDKKLGVVAHPTIGAGIYGIVSNFDSASVDGVNYRKMLDFAVVHGFDEHQLDKLFIDRLCFISKRAVVKERAAGIRLTNIATLVKCTWSYPSAWIKLYPFLMAPKWLCRLAVKRRYYRSQLHLNREGDVAG